MVLTLPPTLALLGVGAGELVVIVLLFLALFGFERIPEIARTVGRFQAQWTKARKEIQREMRTAEERAADEARAFERLRERQVRASRADVQEEERLRAAAESLGVPTEGRSPEELRAAIRDAMDGSRTP